MDYPDYRYWTEEEVERRYSKLDRLEAMDNKEDYFNNVIFSQQGLKISGFNDPVR